MARSFDQYLFDLLNNIRLLIKAEPLNLGAVSGVGGGGGGRAGGYVGYLPQTRVAYDTTESGSNVVPITGASLLDNLNRIRYRLETVESGSGTGIVIKYQDAVVASGVTVLDFDDSDFDVTESPTGEVNISVSGFGSSGIVVKHQDSVVASGITVLDFNDNDFGVTESPTGEINVTVSGIGGGAENLNELGDVIITSPSDNELLAYDSGSGDWINQTPAEAEISVSGHTHVEVDITDLDHDAIKIQTRDVASTAPTDGQVLGWDDGGSQWEPITVAVTASGHEHTYNEDLSSQVVVSGTVFTLSGEPPETLLRVFYNGIRQGTAYYELTGTTLITSFIVWSGDSLLVDYNIGSGTGGGGNGSTGAGGAFNRIVTSDLTLENGDCLHAIRYIEIASDITLELQGDSIIEITY